MVTTGFLVNSTLTAIHDIAVILQQSNIELFQIRIIRLAVQ